MTETLMAVVDSEIIRLGQAYNARAHRIEGSYHAFARLASQATAALAQYARHFGRKPRTEGDVYLLDELAGELEDALVEMEPIGAKYHEPALLVDIDAVRKCRETMRAERAAIARAQTGDGTKEDRARQLGNLANHQFQMYARHIRARPRSARRPGLLVRIVRNLARIDELQTLLLREGLPISLLRPNIEAVRRNREQFEAELAALRSTLEGIPADAAGALLADVANELSRVYALEFGGRGLSTNAADRLGLLCDEFHEVARQMAEFCARTEDPCRYHNLDAALGHVLAMERDYELRCAVPREHPQDATCVPLPRSLAASLLCRG